ncbi:uncharacterized protein UDID_18053 [Ustilago sp. UG-2017a]|nr:uncharacterized protein UDID_18053 [Ustilago sp. UG-2017a]
MTRASTSAASFGLLLVALVLMLHSVVGELAPRHVRHDLFARGDSSDKGSTKLVPNFKEYEARCGDKSDLMFPCFTHWAGDLTAVEVRDFTDGTDIGEKLMIKDAAMKDFTIKYLGDPFEIRYPNHGGVRFQYSDYSLLNGCKYISIHRGDNTAWRIWVSDEVGDDRDLDTLNHMKASKTLCSKWIHIHVKKDGHNFKDNRLYSTD